MNDRVLVQFLNDWYRIYKRKKTLVAGNKFFSKFWCGKRLWRRKKTTILLSKVENMIVS